jgi:hypothetical protein
MPDGDRFGRLRPRYNQVYKQICEGHFSPEQLARELLAPERFQKEINECGEAPYMIAKQATEHISAILLRLIVGMSIDWNDAQEQLETAARGIICSNAVRELTLKACMETLCDMQHGGLAGDLQETIVHRFFIDLFEAKFADCLPLIPEHFDGVSDEFVRGRLEEMRPFVIDELAQFAKQKCEKGAGASLRRSRISKQPIDLDMAVV